MLCRQYCSLCFSGPDVVDQILFLRRGETAKPPSEYIMSQMRIAGRLAKLNTYSLLGIRAMAVEVEVDVSPRAFPKTILVGLPEAAVRDGDRVGQESDRRAR